VTRSQTQALHGVWSLEFLIDGTHDTGGVWIARPVNVPAGSWLMAVEFNVWEPSAGEFNIWFRVASISTVQPQVGADFWVTRPLSVTAGWTPFTYTRAMNLASPQQVWVAVGLAVNWESINTYYIDSVTISWTPFPCDNGTCDFGENPCNCQADCPGAESTELTCDDGIDNDCDLQIDCADLNCSGVLPCTCGNEYCESFEDHCNCPADCPGAESPELTCDDGLDNDCDSATDCADPNCASVLPCSCDDSVCDAPENHCICPQDCPGAESPETTCDDGVDNDCDGRTDCNDDACSANLVCIPTVSTWGMAMTALLLVIAATLILRHDKTNVPQASPH